LLVLSKLMHAAQRIGRGGCSALGVPREILEGLQPATPQWVQEQRLSRHDSSAVLVGT